MPNSFRLVSGFFNVPQGYEHESVVRRVLRFIVLRKFNHLQMSEQRQHFLLSNLKTMSGGLAHGSPVLYQLSQPVGPVVKKW